MWRYSSCCDKFSVLIEHPLFLLFKCWDISMLRYIYRGPLSIITCKVYCNIILTLSINYRSGKKTFYILYFAQDKTSFSTIPFDRPSSPSSSLIVVTILTYSSRQTKVADLCLKTTTTTWWHWLQSHIIAHTNLNVG